MILENTTINIITGKIVPENDQIQIDAYQLFLDEGHADYVFYSSSSRGNIHSQVE